ncbi:MAG TPA: ACT domain-containing protein [Solirubrobacteraceae bacterium]|nr:ACT domain-containing protein [Solirubrobacteraceae bacterium]
MDLRALPGTFAVCRLEAAEELPAWFALAPPLAAAIRRRDELSVVVGDDRVPPGVRAEHGWRALEVAGPLDFGLTGVMADLAGALAGAGVSVLPLATYDTDVILVRDERLDDAAAALRGAGHTVET